MGISLRKDKRSVKKQLEAALYFLERIKHHDPEQNRSHLVGNIGAGTRARLAAGLITIDQAVQEINMLNKHMEAEGYGRSVERGDFT